MTREVGVHRVEDEHRVALMRSEALVVLRDGPMSRTTLQKELRTSKTTAYRTTTALADHGFVERNNDGEYELTAAGDVAADRASGLCQAISAVDHVDPLFELIDRQALDVDPTVFGDATVTHATRDEPHAPLRRFWSVVDDAGRLTLLYDSVHAPNSIDRYADRIGDGLDLTIIYEPDTIENNLRVLEGNQPELLSTNGAELRLASSAFGGGVALTNERVVVMGNDPMQGTQVVAVDTDDPAALEWGRTLVDEHYERSDPVEQ